MNAECMESVKGLRGTAAAEEHCWYAIHVRSRHEFVAYGELRKKGINAFLPSTTRISQWKDRRKQVEYPLFPGYLFVNIRPHAEDFLPVIKTRGMVNFVSLVPGYPTPVSPEEIRALQIVMESGQPVDVYPSLIPGTWIRIKRGPLAGAEGVLADRADQHLFLVNIDILGRSVGLRIYAEDVEPAW